MYSAGAAVTIGLDIDSTWKLVGDFFGFPAWNPMVPSTRAEEDGRYRRDAVEDFPDGSLEERVFRSDRARAYSYRSVNLAGGRFPILSYHGNLKVWPADGGGRSHVAWTNQIVPSEPTDPARYAVVLERMDGGRRRGLGGLITRFGGEFRDLPAHQFSVAAAAELPMSAADLWREVGDFFGQRRWYGTVPGHWREQDRRRVPLGPDEAMVERELSRNDARMTYSYHSTPVEGQLGLDSHIGNVLVWPLASDRCRIALSGQFVPTDPDDVPAAIRVRGALRDHFADGLAGLVGRHGGTLLPAAVSAGGAAVPV